MDRQALPSPDLEQPELAGALLLPCGPIEEKLADIWTSVLGMKRVGVQDNFFDLGGHSLSATRVLSEVTSTFAVQLSLRTLFDHPTIQEMALTITQILTERIAPKMETLSSEERLSVSANLESLTNGPKGALPSSVDSQ